MENTFCGWLLVQCSKWDKVRPDGPLGSYTDFYHWFNVIFTVDHFILFSSLYSPLLVGEQKSYIQQFAAESFSFLMRKIKDSSKLFDILFSTLDTQPDLCQGLGFLCFEMIKGVKKQFHSMTDSVLPVLFSKTGIFQTKSVGVAPGLHWELVCICTCNNYM